MSASSHHVAVLGCGVIGLSTALAILEGQLETPRASNTFVTIVSKEFPDINQGNKEAGILSHRKHPADYASVWAGGHHVSDAKSERELRHDKVTFERMSKLARERPWAKTTSQSLTSRGLPLVLSNSPNPSAQHEPLVWVHQTELFEAATNPPISSRPPFDGVLDWYPDFKSLPSSRLAQGLGWGCTFSTIDINVPVYHKWLLFRFLELGGRLVVAKAKSLRDAIRFASSPSTSAVVCRDNRSWTTVGKVDVLVASPGLGARFIEGIHDEAVHPQRGQVVVVNAPWLSTDTSLSKWSDEPRYKLPGFSVVRPQGGREVYVIPRGDGTVICGGTRIVDDWDPNPRLETTRRILERCLALVPQLADPRKCTELAKPKVEDVDVVRVNVGLRPARKGGVRLERAKEDIDGVRIVYNYGYGGAGYQASWGAALDAKQLVEEALESGSKSLLRPSRL